jgi:hypothetical protein
MLSQFCCNTNFYSNLAFDSDLVSCNIWPSQLYSVIHDMLKNWPTPLLGSRAHCSYVRLSVRLGHSALSVSESDQETFVTNQIATRFCSSKRIYLTSNPHESCSPVRLDEFGVLNRLILISKAQDIPLWISNVKTENLAARRV